MVKLKLREGHIIQYFDFNARKLESTQEYLANWYSSVFICSHIYDNQDYGQDGKITFNHTRNILLKGQGYNQIRTYFSNIFSYSNSIFSEVLHIQVFCGHQNHRI